MTRSGNSEKPAGTWAAEQVVDRMIDWVGVGDFCVICPDNAVFEALDAARIRWSAGDMTKNWPTHSR